jgi:hypothetical protein
MGTRHKVDLRSTRQEFHALFFAAAKEDTDFGGRYKSQAAALNIWSHPWLNEATRYDSAIIGTLSVDWSPYCIDAIACEEGFELEDLLHELAILEQKALGHAKHGRR